MKVGSIDGVILGGSRGWGGFVRAGINFGFMIGIMMEIILELGLWEWYTCDCQIMRIGVSILE